MNPAYRSSSWTAGWRKLSKIARDRLGQLDILTNSAGGSRPVPWNVRMEIWEKAMTLIFTSTGRYYPCTSPGDASAQVGKSDQFAGNVGATRTPNAAFPAKPAVYVWANGMSREFAKRGVTVNSIQPGCRTIVNFANELIPIGRFGEAEELPICFVESTDSALYHYSTGGAT